MFIEYFSNNVAVLVAVLRKSAASANTNEYWWPEAERTADPLFFR